MALTSIGLACLVVACFCAVVYGGASDDFTPETIIKLEREALDRWSKGDPQGFFDLGAPDETYFDPTVERRVDGADKVKALLLPLRGKLAIDRYEMRDPLVQRDSNVAVLTFNLLDYGVRVDGVDKGTIAWNATEVYQRIDGSWKIIHSHWSYIKPN